MVNGVILDTDTLSFVLRGDEAVINALMDVIDEHGFVSISAITCYEAFAGLHFKDAKRKLSELQQLVAINRVIPFGKKEAERAGTIRGTLRRAGITIGHLDIMIAATALEHNLIVITNNLKHFGHIPELQYKTWVNS